MRLLSHVIIPAFDLSSYTEPLDIGPSGSLSPIWWLKKDSNPGDQYLLTRTEESAPLLLCYHRSRGTNYMIEHQQR